MRRLPGSTIASPVQHRKWQAQTCFHGASFETDGVLLQVSAPLPLRDYPPHELVKEGNRERRVTVARTPDHAF